MREWGCCHPGARTPHPPALQPQMVHRVPPPPPRHRHLAFVPGAPSASAAPVVSCWMRRRWRAAVSMPVGVGCLPHSLHAGPTSTARHGCTRSSHSVFHPTRCTHQLRVLVGHFCMGSGRGAPLGCRHLLAQLALWQGEWPLLAPDGECSPMQGAPVSVFACFGWVHDACVCACAGVCRACMPGSVVGVVRGSVLTHRIFFFLLPAQMPTGLTHAPLGRHWAAVLPTTRNPAGVASCVPSAPRLFVGVRVCVGLHPVLSPR